MKKVLIVDDAIDTRSILRSILKQKPIEIFEATTGIEAWDLILKVHPDLIILDIHMPEMDGLDLLREMKNEWIDTPVAIISEDTSTTIVESAKILGAKHFIKKPLERNEIINTLKEFVLTNE